MTARELFMTTSAYRLVASDKAAGTLSHAYLLLTPDDVYLRVYLKVLAKLLACRTTGACGECRACKLIESERHADVRFIPEKTGGKTLSADVEEIIADSYIRPLEGDKKIYVVSGAEQMTAAAQNKLLKTLEEPPRGVYILLGATSEYPLLPTVRSRVKMLTVPPYQDKALFDCLQDKCPDADQLMMAIADGDGTVGKAEKLYGDAKLGEMTSLAAAIIVSMKSSRDVLEYAGKLSEFRGDLVKFVGVLAQMFRDMLAEAEGGEVRNAAARGLYKRAGDFSEGALIYALEKTAEAEKMLAFNVNETMLADRLLFAILEGKYKWQKSSE